MQRLCIHSDCLCVNSCLFFPSLKLCSVSGCSSPSQKKYKSENGALFQVPAVSVAVDFKHHRS